MLAMTFDNRLKSNKLKVENTKSVQLLFITDQSNKNVHEFN